MEAPEAPPKCLARRRKTMLDPRSGEEAIFEVFLRHCKTHVFYPALQFKHLDLGLFFSGASEVPLQRYDHNKREAAAISCNTKREAGAIPCNTKREAGAIPCKTKREAGAIPCNAMPAQMKQKARTGVESLGCTGGVDDVGSYTISGGQASKHSRLYARG